MKLNSNKRVKIMKHKGFTLVELMVVVAIMGILVAVGYPSYAKYVTKSKRADAMKSLELLAGAMESFYGVNETYAGATVNAAGTGTVGSNQSADGYYTLSISGNNAFGYTLTATPVKADPDCTTMKLNSLGKKTATGADAANCWK